MQTDQSSKNEKWVRINPLETPKLSIDALPKHTPERFVNYIEIFNAENVAIGFKLPDDETNQFIFDQDGGWRDEFGCHYDADGKPNGWFVLNSDKANKEHYYDVDGLYVPTLEDDEKIDDVELGIESDSAEEEGGVIPLKEDEIVKEYKQGLGDEEEGSGEEYQEGEGNNENAQQLETTEEKKE